ncbi:hypothetical protein E2I00_016380, partial [Balaenoptera physalus]
PKASQTRHPAECPTERGYFCSGKGVGATREQKPVGFGRSIWREGMKTTAPGHAEGQKRGPPNPGEGSPHSSLWNM